MTIRAGRGDYRHYKPQYVEAGDGISIDKTDPVRPIITNDGVRNISSEPSAHNSLVVSEVPSGVLIGNGEETYVQVYTSGDWASVSDTDTTPPYDTVISDTNSEMIGPAFTPKRTGKYLFTAQFYQKANSVSSGYLQTRLNKYSPGGTLLQSRVLDILSASKVVRAYNVTGIFWMAAGESARMIIHSSGYSQEYYGMNNNSCAMQVVRILT